MFYSANHLFDSFECQKPRLHSKNNDVKAGLFLVITMMTIMSTSCAKYMQENMFITPSLYIGTTLTFYPNSLIG